MAEPSPLWRSAIAELTDAQCRNGLTRLAQLAKPETRDAALARIRRTLGVAR